jgi:hypothetical protein
MTTSSVFPLEGGCDCRHVRYRMMTRPLFVHCCHCRWCQRETGAAFALNAMIESDRVVDLGAPPDIVDTPSESGLGQKIARCPRCRIAVWSHYAGAGPLVRSFRSARSISPISAARHPHLHGVEQPWVVLGQRSRRPEYYDREQNWPPESLARRQILLPKIEA